MELAEALLHPTDCHNCGHWLMGCYAMTEHANQARCLLPHKAAAAAAAIPAAVAAATVLPAANSVQLPRTLTPGSVLW